MKIRENHGRRLVAGMAVMLLCISSLAQAVDSGPRLRPEDRVTQEQIASGALSLREIREAGLLVFATPFNRADGYGDGPHEVSVADNRDAAAGNRPGLQSDHDILRVNGLDSQSCLECHSVVSTAVVPAVFGVGGGGGINNSAIFQPDRIDVADGDFDGIAELTGRLINPPFLFGAGGVELLAREMTADLQALMEQALDQPGTTVPLVTKGVSFGEIVADEFGLLDTTGVEGVGADLVVRPFGRKGDKASAREFGVSAMSFHMGMQAAEAFGGEHADADNDGVYNEISVGDLSALSIFITTMERPWQEGKGYKKHSHGKSYSYGAELFNEIGCAECHRPVMNTDSRYLHYKLTGSPQEPFADTFYSVDLTRPPMKFPRAPGGGIQVPMYSDLKRHDMGEGLQESFSKATTTQNREFITARLWGVADSAPYLHDGRALTLSEAITAHDSPGSEAAPAAQAYAALDEDDREKLIGFLMTLRTPERPNADVVRR